MHVATIFLLILVLVLVAFLVNGAIVTCSLSRCEVDPEIWTGA